MRPTRAGLLVALAGTSSFALGRVFGLEELYAIGAASILLVVVSAGWVLFRELALTVHRRARPPRVHAGNPCTVAIEVRNTGRRGSPVLRLLDPVTATAGADLLLPPIGVRSVATVSYRLPTTRRGIVTVGPMTVEISDPFGIARARTHAAPPIEITVLPRVDEIPPLPRSVGPDPDGSTETGSLGRLGEDFAALRPYIVGDDLRRVHWPSSARHGELLVRQHDVPWQGRVCVLLDQRFQSGTGDLFERVVSAAASILRTHIRRGDHARLVTTSGLDSGYGIGPGHLELLLEQLAIVQPDREGSLGTALEVVSRGGSGALVVASGTPTPTDLQIVDRVANLLSLRRVVRFDEPGRGLTAAGTEVIGIGPDTPFAAAWTESLTARAGGGTRRRKRAGSTR